MGSCWPFTSEGTQSTQSLWSSLWNCWTSSKKNCIQQHQVANSINVTGMSFRLTWGTKGLLYLHSFVQFVVTYIPQAGFNNFKWHHTSQYSSGLIYRDSSLSVDKRAQTKSIYWERETFKFDKPFADRLSIFESGVYLLRFSIEKDGRSTCRQKKHISALMLIEYCWMKSFISMYCTWMRLS